MVVEKSQSASPTTASDIFSYVFYLFVIGVSGYYGWILGRRYAYSFWVFVQAIGAAIGRILQSIFNYAVQATARLSR